MACSREDAKRAIVNVLREAHGSLGASELLRRVTALSIDLETVVVTARAMLEAGDIEFNPGMLVSLVHEMA